jgi:hypothetical protein
MVPYNLNKDKKETFVARSLNRIADKVKEVSSAVTPSGFNIPGQGVCYVSIS